MYRKYSMQNRMQKDGLGWNKKEGIEWNKIGDI